MFCCATLVSVARANLDKTDFKFGPRPESGFFDPADIITDAQRKEIAAPLARILEEEGIDVMVVLLPEKSSVPAKFFVSFFFENWKKSEINAVVFYVPGEPGSPWIFPGAVVEKVVSPEILKASVAAAEKRARAEPDDFGKIRAASIEAADVMRYWTGGAILRTESILYEREKQLAALERKKRLLKIGGMLGAAAGIPLIVGLAFLINRIRQDSPRNFPNVRKISRLGAPYAGGNTASTRIK